EAMESRAWGAIQKRTNLYILKIERADLVLFLVSVSILIIGVYLRLNVGLPSFSDLFGLGTA
ncbi:MAG: hypothetical protein JSW72_04750, partial [Candidatus Bathyarchaeota archaeon]